VSVAALTTVLSHPASIADQFEALRSQVAGQIITPDSADYDAARTIAIGAHRRPLAIIRVIRAADVAAVVNFARENALPIAVRSGGHSVAGHSMVDGGVVVDFSAMKRASIDPVTRVARVQAGATSGDLAGPAHEHGLALTTGDTASVGLGGLVTGGGIGFMVRKYGLTIDNLLEAQVVLATGEIVTASATEHPDLFWAIRGGGGNLGIITEFTFRLAEVDQVLGGLLVLPATREVIRGYLDHSVSAPDDLTTIANVMHAPPMPFVPQEWIGKPVVAMFVTWTGDLEEGQRALAPMRALAEPVIDMVSPMPYPAMYQFTEHQEAHHSTSVRMMFADHLSDDAIDTVLDALDHASSPMSVVQLRGLGGAYGRVANDATAFAHRERKVFVSILNLWMDGPENDAVHELWTASLWKAIRHEGKGVYVNFLENEGEDRIREAYPNGTYERLRAIKTAYDPDNLFRSNQNILPKA
jgi:FAD/FMN-containing dehydrogenase